MFKVLFVVIIASIIAHPVFCHENSNIAPQAFPKIIESHSVERKEIIMLDNLITATKRNLKNQQEIRDLVKEFQALQDQYEKSQQDKELLYSMVKTAHKLLSKIRDNHLTQSFDPSYISELTVFSQIAQKRGIPKP